MVRAGFSRELERLIEHNRSDEAQVREARNRALTLVELEWANRGLGGFKGWCRTEGEEAAQRFRSIAR